MDGNSDPVQPSSSYKEIPAQEATYFPDPMNPGVRVLVVDLEYFAADDPLAKPSESMIRIEAADGNARYKIVPRSTLILL